MGDGTPPPPTGEPVGDAAAPPPPTGLPIPTRPAVTELATPEAAGDGVNRCGKCGASEVTYDAAAALFTCAFCRHQWGALALDAAMKLSEGIAELKGTVRSTAAADIVDSGALVTLACTGCGAEVVIDTDHNLRARCHWCKHELSLNNKVPNGAVPDGILPFTVTKEQAMASIAHFVQERKNFALPAFSASFRPDNVMGVYLPYMTVDGNVSARLDGLGEVLEARIKVGDNKTAYRVRRFNVTRSFDVTVDDVVVETASSKADIHSTVSTNNIINSVLPFDVKNIVRFTSNFLGETFTSERRDMDIDHAEAYASQHFMTIARGAASRTITGYDRGVRWDAEQLHIKGSRWTSVLLPVWLYGFVEQKNGQAITHYMAVNGRTGATMGSVPINSAKANAVSWAVAAGISIVTWPIAIAILAAAA